VHLRAFLDSAAGSASVYVMDEPTAALTGEESERLFAVLREIRRSGRSVLYVSHRLDEVMRLCDRVTVLRDGQVIGTSDIADTTVGRNHPHDDRPRRRRRLSAAAGAGRHDVALAVEASKARHRAGRPCGAAGRDRRAGRPFRRRPERGPEADRRRRTRAARQVRLNGKARSRQGLPASWKSGIAYVPRERRSEGLILGHPIGATSRCRTSRA
jgi:ribose transport system ATP-binding protein